MNNRGYVWQEFWSSFKSNDFFSSYGIIIGFFIADLFENKYVNFEKTDNLGNRIRVGYVCRSGDSFWKTKTFCISKIIN